MDDEILAAENGGSADGFRHFLKAFRAVFWRVVARGPAPWAMRLADFDSIVFNLFLDILELFFEACLIQLEERTFCVGKVLEVKAFITMLAHAFQAFFKTIS